MCRLVVQCLSLQFSFFKVHAGKLGQVTTFTKVGDTAKHCVDQHMALFRYCSLEGDIVIPDGLYARLFHTILVSSQLSSSKCAMKIRLSLIHI